MYNFIDTIQVSESALLPSEALKINGQFIEELIPGYRTLHVTGREALSKEIETYETGIRDGSLLKNRRYPARIITVGYQLSAADNSSFRTAYNTLARVLDVQDAELIFNDEDDKFFVGTPSGIGEVDPGRNSVVGEFDILCADPFKYSVLEYEAETSDEDPTTVLVDYGGTYKAFPKLVAEFYNETEIAEDGTTTTLTGKGDCGYVAFFNENEQIIQIGDPDEVDTETVKPQTLINQMFKVSTAWGASGQAPWVMNTGPITPENVTKVGSVGLGVAKTATSATQQATSGTLLKDAKAFGGNPDFYYTVTAKTSGRTSTSVTVEVAVTTRLRKSTNYFGKGYGLKGSLYIGGAWHDVTIKKTSTYWKGNSGHTVNMSFTVTGLSATTTSLTDIKFKATRTDSSGSAGELDETACSNLTISAYATPETEMYYLTATDYGTASGAWHGPSMTRAIPADSAGIVGATDFVFTWKQRMYIGSGTNATNQLGGIHVNLSAADGSSVAAFRIRKSMTGKAGTLLFYVGGDKVYQSSVDLTSASNYFGVDSNTTCKIEKNGNSVLFDIAGIASATVSDALTETAVTHITFMFEKYSDKETLSYNGIYEIKFNKTNYELPNSFSANDVLEADCKNGDIYLNGLLTPKLGALGNDWEGFYLTEGLNQIGVGYSAWVEPAYAPKMKVLYREVFL